MNLRGKISSYGEVGGQQVQQALLLQTQEQGGDQESYPDDMRKAAARQVVLTKGVRVCSHDGLPETVRPPI